MSRLLLEVVSAQGAAMGASRRRLVGPDGIQIGREGSGPLVWVLPDSLQYVSRHHATIRFLNGLFFIEGKGRTPIALNARERTLRNDDPHPLNDGDRIFIDEYEIRARLGTEASLAFPPEPEPVFADPVADLSRWDWPPPAADGRDRASREPAIAPAETVDPIKLLGGSRPSPVTPAPPPAAARGAVDAFLEQAFAPGPEAPASLSGPSLADDWFIAKSGASASAGGESKRSGAGVLKDRLDDPPGSPPRPAASPQVQARRAAGKAPQAHTASGPGSGAGREADDGLVALLRGAGLDVGGRGMAPEVERQLGEALRIVVQGTMDVLRARTEIKNQFRMPVTQLAPRDNNPLKFSVNATDALHNLLLKNGGAFLSTPEAFEDAFEDIRFHQLAMFKGIESGFERLMSHFDPEATQQRFDKAIATTGALGKLASGSKARRWEQYVESYRELASDRDDTFRRFFGDAFALAYEKELSRLKTSSRAARRPPGARS